MIYEIKIIKVCNFIIIVVIMININDQLNYIAQLKKQQSNPTNNTKGIQKSENARTMKTRNPRLQDL